MKKINFEDGQLITAGYVEIDGIQHEIHEAEYHGNTPLSSHVLNTLQNNIENELVPNEKVQGNTITMQNACNCKSDLKVYGKTIQNGKPNPNNPIEIKNIKNNIEFIKENEDGSVSETITFSLNKDNVLHEKDYLVGDGIHQKRNTLVLDGTENWTIGTLENGYYRFYLTLKTAIKNNEIVIISSHFEGIPYNNRNSNYDNKIYSSGTNIGINTNIKTNITDWKAYLAERYSNKTPIIIEYELEEEIIILYTQEQQDIYNKLCLMYEGYNKISCTNEIKPNLECIYYYNNDLNNAYVKRLDKLEDRIKLLENGG